MFKTFVLTKQFNSFRKGDEEAFKYFYGRYYARIRFYLIYCMHIDEAGAEELTRRAFQALCDNYSQIKSLPHIRAYLYYLAHKCGKRYLEGKPCTEEDWDQPVPPAAEILCVLHEFVVVMGEAEIEYEIQQLFPRQRQIMEMRFLQKIKPEAIAEQLGISISTVRNTIRQSEVRLRIQLGADFHRDFLYNFRCR